MKGSKKWFIPIYRAFPEPFQWIGPLIGGFPRDEGWSFRSRRDISLARKERQISLAHNFCRGSRLRWSESPLRPAHVQIWFVAVSLFLSGVFFIFLVWFFAFDFLNVLSGFQWFCCGFFCCRFVLFYLSGSFMFFLFIFRSGFIFLFLSFFLFRPLII